MPYISQFSQSSPRLYLLSLLIATSLNLIKDPVSIIKYSTYLLYTKCDESKIEGKMDYHFWKIYNFYFLVFFPLFLCRPIKCCSFCYNILDPGRFSNFLLTNWLWTLFSLPWRSGIHQSQNLITQAQARHTVRTCFICYLALPMHINLSWLKTALYQRQPSTKESQIILIGPWLRSSDTSASGYLVSIQTQVPLIKFSTSKSLCLWKV